MSSRIRQRARNSNLDKPYLILSGGQRMASASHSGSLVIGAQVLAVLLVLIGLVLTRGGAWLIFLRGSPYYLVAGLALLGSGWFLFRLRPIGAWIYGAMFVLTFVRSRRTAGSIRLRALQADAQNADPLVVYYRTEIGGNHAYAASALDPGNGPRSL
jgi:hypothetical protein